MQDGLWTGDSVNWQTTTAPTSILLSVPEPGSIGLLLIGGLPLLAQRRRAR